MLELILSCGEGVILELSLSCGEGVCVLMLELSLSCSEICNITLE